LLAYVIAIIIIIFLNSFVSDYPILLKIAILDLVATAVIFIFSLVFNNSSLYDPYWSLKPLVIAVYYSWILPLGQLNLIQILTLFGVFLYAIRLTGNFYYGWPGMSHEDWRYRNFRSMFPRLYWLVSFMGIHLFPTIMVYLGCLPMYGIFTAGADFNWLVIPGIFILYGSVVLAFVADQQLHRFRNNPLNKGKTIQSGLWARSRHPNYLGEMLTGWGLFLIVIASDVQYWWSISGALLISVMFVFISIPLIEKHSLKRRNDYEAYRKKVPMLLPGSRN
jgi:steroid 5-alpha reductase family enzyme